MDSAPLARMILSPKHLPRLVSTVRLFTNYGLRDFANGQGLLSLDSVSLDDQAGVEGDARTKAKAFRERLVELGPAYIKLGQVLSTRPAPATVHRRAGAPAGRCPADVVRGCGEDHRGGAEGADRQALRVIRGA